MHRLVISLLCLMFVPAARCVAKEWPAERIWDAAPHCAFTDLIEFDGRVLCVFREANRHVHGDNGRIRVIASDDGRQWESFALLALDGIDLRDPKVSVTPDGRCMLLIGGSRYEGKSLMGCAPQVAFLDPGADGFGEIRPVVIDESVRTGSDWLWRVTWHGNEGFGVVYQPAGGGKSRCHLMRTRDGVRYEQVAALALEGRPNEATVRFDPDGRMRMVVRNESGDGDIGAASAPFTDWTWRKIPARLGGPDFARLPDGTWVLATRHYGPPTRTVLGRLGDDGAFVPQVFLPSGGDTSYAGLLVRDGKLWVSYYSSHEEKTAIYLAMLPIGAFDAQSAAAPDP